MRKGIKRTFILGITVDQVNFLFSPFDMNEIKKPETKKNAGMANASSCLEIMIK
jgi:hypothetical protein